MSAEEEYNEIVEYLMEGDDDDDADKMSDIDISDYADDETGVGEEVCTDMVLESSSGDENEGVVTRVCARRPGPSSVKDDDGGDKVNFSLLSWREQLLPLMYVRPVNEQQLILANAEKSGFKIVDDMDKVMDKVLVKYIETMPMGATRDLFVDYARQRKLKV